MSKSDKPDARFLPVVIDSKASAARVEEAEQIGIFEIDGTTYSMPNVVRAELALEYLAITNDEGDDKAAHWLLTETLGEDAYKALRSVKGLEGDTFDGIMTRVRKVALPKDKSQPAKTARR